ATPLNATGLTVGNTYYIRIYVTTNPNAGGNPNQYDFSICIVSPPANDDCSGAVTLTSGTTNSAGTVWLATASSSIPVDCATGNPDDDVWYKITATATNLSVTLSAIGSNLSTSGTRIQLFSGSCASLTTIACGTTNLSATGISIGSTYYIRVYSFGTGSIGGTSSGSAFSITATTPPGNDECANAYLVPTATSCFNSQGTLTGATASAGIPIGSCTGNPDDDVWYKFVATKSNPTITLSSIAASITGTGAGSRLQLLSGSCGSLTSVSCGTTSIAASGLTVGSTYYTRVYSNASTSLTSATFDICVTDPTPDIMTDSTTTLFYIDTVAKQLGYPWEITYGPDDSLWVTEARGYRVLRMSSSRTQTEKNVLPQQVLKIPLGSSMVSFSRSIGTWPQGGMEGLAIHPEFMTNSAKRWVYIAYVYDGTCPSSAASPCIFRSKIVRCQFYFSIDAGNPTSIPKRDTLVILDTVISNLPGSNDHNSGRLKIDPVTEGSGTPTYKLYYTIGDMGAGQFNNTTRINNAQNKDTCEGKVLRLNTEPDGDASFGVTHDYNTWRQWIPNDNPFTHSTNGLRTPIYSYGHRNAQGLAWGNVNGTWRLYSSEHGDHSDDEVNIIQSGKNFGWPKVSGLADNNYTTIDDATDGFTFNNILANQTVTDEITFANATPEYTNPVFSFFNWSAAQIETSNTGNIFNWPTVAPSSIDFYSSTQIPGWQNSLLVTSLKYGLFRLKLKSTGDAIDSSLCANAADTIPLLHSWRVRDITISPNGAYIWAIIDSSGSTSGPTGGFNGSSANTKDGGKVLKLSFKNIIVLPVNFITLSGRVVNNATELTWEAIIDQEHKYFEIEKSDHLNGFVSIGKVYGSAPYKFTDYSPSIGNNYYRVKAVDISGHVTYSKTINVIYNDAFFTMIVYPNPIKDDLNIKLNSKYPDIFNIQITDVSGRVVYQKNINNTSALTSIDVRLWQKQIYIMKVVNSNNEIMGIAKFIKQ
ncbi:MAG: PQQ-dependent sugar dehydrogenase, partial [Bacteroidota bacterium]|nr:PQQ-dependent sugar dehydrogenase [Bacteroidota bacterium]